MSISVTFNSAHRILLASEFFMARRPVVDRQQDLVAHELLFCNPSGDAPFAASAEQPASASVLSDVHQHGLSRVIGELTGILYIDHDALMSDIFQFLPPQNVVLEIAATPNPSPQMVERLAALTAAGFRFALVIKDDSADVQQLLPMAEGVRIDITGRDAANLERLCGAFRGLNKRLLAERVETIEQFRMCHALGFDYFQGYYFLQPHILQGKRISPSHQAITELMALITSDADNAEIEHSIKSHVTLGLNLLRLVNTPAISSHRIDSLRQALMVLGRDQLQRWLQVMLYAEPGLHGRSVLPLMAQATTRGRLIELIAQKLRPGNRSIADTGFTVGIMSLVDTLFSMPMEDILQQIPVVEEVGDALLHRQGYFGKLLALAEYVEWKTKTDAQLLQATRELKLTCNDLYMIQLAAFEWSDHVTSCMH
ncbi:MAG TPA: EAL domain-containing protein [Noviherbaspirillum sp.]|uniref:EAL and HDOD domain-containing protein n=1 Tax=Noviherbaspirillum sp. TaxID=1926288 RepID=UPI002B480F46|nr:EAL domain-containing protein [Noviherbaspirillum sp.]HJV84419.1 EAL domain-containing protein [Noviherbaspirillum sp.]